MTEPQVQRVTPDKAGSDSHPGSSVKAGEGLGSVRVAGALALLCVLLVTYAPTFTVTYGMTDDYSFLASSVNGHPGRAFEILRDAGRPLGGLLLDVLFRLPASIGDLRALRLLTIMGITAVAVALCWLLRRESWSKASSLAVPVLVCTLPPFVLFASWTQQVVVPVACLAGLAGAVVAHRAASASGIRRAAGLGASSMLLMLVAILVYQPAAMFFWVAAAVLLLSKVTTTRVMARSAAVCGAAFALAVCAAFALFRLTAARGPVADRARIVEDLADKLRYVVKDPLMRALNLHSISASWHVAGVVLAVIVLGFGVMAARRGRQGLPFLLIAAALVPLAYFPNLVVAENYGSYRTQAALGPLVLLYLAMSVRVLASEIRLVVPSVRSWSRGTRQRVASVVLLGLALSGMVLACAHAVNLVVMPQYVDLAVLRDQVRRTPLAGVRRVLYIRPTWEEGLADRGAFDEFGLQSSAADFAAQPMLYLLTKEAGIRRPDFKVDVLPPGSRPKPGPGDVVIDMQRAMVFLDRAYRPSPN